MTEFKKKKSVLNIKKVQKKHEISVDVKLLELLNS